MVSTAQTAKRRTRLTLVGYIVAGCAAVPTLIYGFVAWRDEGFHVFNKLSPPTGQGGGFFMFLIGIILLVYAGIGLQYHFTRVERRHATDASDDSETI